LLVAEEAWLNGNWLAAVDVDDTLRRSVCTNE